MLQFSETWSRLLQKRNRAQVKILQIATQVLLSLFFAGLTGLCARLRVYLPFTPVPITGQVFAVLLSGIVLGKGWGSLSQMLYTGLGLLGIPWFVVGPIGPTGGYIVGFITAPYLIGSLLQSRLVNGRRAGMLFTFLAASLGVILIYLFGSIQFKLFTGADFVKTMKLAVLPFIPFDLAKAAAAAAVSFVILGRTGNRPKLDQKREHES